MGASKCDGTYTMSCDLESHHEGLCHFVALDQIENLKHELAEANAEIARHHRDFQIVRDLLDAKDEHWDGLARAVRNVVG